jgi:hypothetical protein
MANIDRHYRRQTTDGSTTVTITAYIGADVGDKDEIRRIVEQGGVVTEDGIAYFGTTGSQWLEEQHARLVADGFQPAQDR